MNKVIGIIKKQNEVLIGKVKDERLADFGGIKYVFPGGSVEDGETLEQAVIREIKEETGLDAVIIDNVGSRTHPITGKVIHYFVCEALSDELDTNHPLNDDLSELIWVNVKELNDYMPTLFYKVKSHLTTDADLISYSATVKSGADELLKSHNLLENLSSLGDVEIVGSYKLDLMWQKDIDFYVTKDELPNFEGIIDFINKSFKSADFYYQKYEDNSQLIKPNLPKGKGLFIKLNSGWKLDIWFLSKADANEKESQTQLLFKGIDESTRTEILRLKMESIEVDVYNKKFTSFDLYKACVEHETERITKYLN